MDVISTKVDGKLHSKRLPFKLLPKEIITVESKIKIPLNLNVSAILKETLMKNDNNKEFQKKDLDSIMTKHNVSLFDFPLLGDNSREVFKFILVTSKSKKIETSYGYYFKHGL